MSVYLTIYGKTSLSDSLRKEPSQKQSCLIYKCFRLWLRAASRTSKTQEKCFRGKSWNSTPYYISASQKKTLLICNRSYNIYPQSSSIVIVRITYHQLLRITYHDAAGFRSHMDSPSPSLCPSSPVRPRQDAAGDQAALDQLLFGNVWKGGRNESWIDQNYYAYVMVIEWIYNGYIYIYKGYI